MSITNTNDTPWCGYADDKLYLQSGQFTSTIKDSVSIGAIESVPFGISWDGQNTPWCGIGDDKLYLQSGQFTSTIKDSESVGGVDASPQGISYDPLNTPWCGTEADKLYLQSGQYTSTLKTSEDVSLINAGVSGISYDGQNTPWCGEGVNDKLYLQSGQFTSTIKDSEDINGVDTGPQGISWDGTNTPWCGDQADKLYLQSGQLTSTVKTSLDVSAVEGSPSGISTNQISLRINIEEPDPVSSVADVNGPSEVIVRNSIFLIGPSATDVTSFLEVYPDYDYAFPLTKEQIQNRTLSGKLYSYTFFTYNKFEIPESWVNSENRTTINSFWQTNANLEFYTDYNSYPNSYYDVRITNDEEPYPQFVKPYFNQFFRGTLKLEEY